MATSSVWQRFRHWRRRRPFWGGLFLVLAALALFLSANLTLEDLQVHFGQEGYLSYVLPIALLLCGLLSWFTPAQRLFYGIIGVLTALYSFIGLNLGGFGLGMIFGIVGGALTIAWTPSKPPAPRPPFPAEPDPEHETAATPAQDETLTSFFGDENDDRDRHEEHGDGHPYRKTFVFLLVPLALAAAVLAAGRTPARAGPCPDGLPSRPAAEARAEASRQSRPQPSASAKPPTSAAPATPAPQRTPEPSASAPEEPADEEGDPARDGFEEFVEGIGDLLGIGGDEDDAAAEPAEPSPSPSAPPAPEPEPTATSTPPAEPSPTGSGTPTGAPGTTAPDPGGATPAAPASPSPTPELPDVPCLGPRVFKQGDPDGVPVVSQRGGLLEGDKLTMYDSTYDGVVDVPLAGGGTREVLKFSMRKSVTEPFSLTVPERDGRTTLITSGALTTEGDVRFYTPKFTGKLFGLIPVTFTPAEPPPLTLPVLWFTDVAIELVFVRCDTLTGDPLKVEEKG